MAAVWMKLAAILCLCGSGLGEPGRGEVVEKKSGTFVTIQCSSSESHLQHLDLKKGLYKDVSVFHKSPNETHVGPEFTGRVQENGAFPNTQVLITNLTSDDTGLYWCMYRQSKESEEQQGNGSVLLVVTASILGDNCRPGVTHGEKVLVSVLASAGLLLSIIMCVLMWLIKTIPQSNATTYATVTPRADPNSCIYEEMSGMLRGPPASSHATESRNTSCDLI